ncbi:COX15/CtaA family protein [Engelhardtia mirabilis]|uniref:Heme A synthase n=1 Tax=Engelhardtia mirabilis TaxID=2528011 RepID=A0A518BIZ3_9BACT|nr:Heme A synthase [Planctomycetes bacterium Pla133]QDV01261.1 Heme A synthase [Planctomycetes bacterium Pla86]
MTATESTAAPSAWPYRFSLGAVLCAVPLFLFGGVITTIGAGMAVKGWWNAEGHFMPLFPIDMWLRDFGTFVEHTHRLWAMAVGLFALLAVAFAFRSGRGASARWATVVALLAVIGQGTLGGFRVLENSPDLAFLHGVAAQGVFAILAASALVLSRRWRVAQPAPAGVDLGATRALAWLLALLVYGQIAVGCWYRHGLRQMVGDGVGGRLHVHLTLAFLVLAAVIVVARKLGANSAAAGDSEAAGRLRGLKVRLHALVGVQILLGLLAWWAYDAPAPGDPKTHSEFEITLSVLHVLGGALLLAQSVAAALWLGRLGNSVADGARTSDAVA